jgi:hypothetical protein
LARGRWRRSRPSAAERSVGNAVSPASPATQNGIDPSSAARPGSRLPGGRHRHGAEPTERAAPCSR